MMHDNYDPYEMKECTDKQQIERDVPRRGSVLIEAIDVINGARQDQYGNPENSFELISDLWEAFLKPKIRKALNRYDIELPKDFRLDLEPKDSTLMMVLFKIAREEHQKKRDNLRDGAGYLGIASDM